MFLQTGPTPDGDVAGGKKNSAALTAVMRKLITIISARIRDALAQHAAQPS